MVSDMIDPGLPLAEQNARLRAILAALMDRAEHGQMPSRPAGQLTHMVALEQQVRARTRDLAETLDKLRVANARLSQAERDATGARNTLVDALEAMGEGFAMFDARDRLTLWNSQFCAALPDIRDQLGTGLAFQDYVNMVSDSDAIDLPGAQERRDWIAQRLQSHMRRNVNFTVPLVGDHWLQVSEQRMNSGGTAVIQTDVTTMVRTERLEREKLLDEQAQMVRATLDHIDQAVLIFDAKARLAGWNRRLREIFAPPNALLTSGTLFSQILNDLIRRNLLGRGNIRHVLTDWVQGPAFRAPLALDIVQEDGTELRLSAQAMPDRGFVISFTDLTTERRAIAEMHRMNETLEARVQDRTGELVAARDAAERANASKSRFVASASHDLLQPLNAAKLFLASLAASDNTPAQARLIERVQSAFTSVEDILAALLDLSKFDIGAARARIDTVPLAPLFARLRNEFQPMADRRGLTLVVMPTRLCVQSDPVYLKRILQNLVSNALRYTETGRVVLGARRRGAQVQLQVWDSGPGIPPDKQAEIFEEFTRLNPAGESGMGLGLAIVEQACALLDHPVSLKSGLGQGTMFSVTAPKALLQPDTAADPGEQPPGLLSDRLVLVIENDTTSRRALTELLEDWGASPIEAASSADAKVQIAELGLAPDVILADHQLDDGATGLDAIAALRAAHGQIPAILVTADHGPALAEQAEDAGVLVMTKPLALRRLKRVLQQVPRFGSDQNAPDATLRRGDHSYWLHPKD
jgi:signal transduction histidine kinase/CheY-like chemotaxis protein